MTAQTSSCTHYWSWNSCWPAEVLTVKMHYMTHQGSSWCYLETHMGVLGEGDFVPIWSHPMRIKPFQRFLVGPEWSRGILKYFTVLEALWGCGTATLRIVLSAIAQYHNRIRTDRSYRLSLRRDCRFKCLNQVKRTRIVVGKEASRVTTATTNSAELPILYGGLSSQFVERRINTVGSWRLSAYACLVLEKTLICGQKQYSEALTWLDLENADGKDKGHRYIYTSDKITFIPLIYSDQYLQCKTREVCPRL